VANQEDKARGMDTRKKSKKQAEGVKFIDHNPQAQEKPVLEAMLERPEEIYQALQSVIDSGLNFSVSVDGRTGATRVFLFDPDVSYQVRVYVAFWSHSIERCLVQLAHAWATGVVRNEDGLDYGRQMELPF